MNQSGSFQQIVTWLEQTFKCFYLGNLLHNSFFQESKEIGFTFHLSKICRSWYFRIFKCWTLTHRATFFLIFVVRYQSLLHEMLCMCHVQSLPSVLTTGVESAYKLIRFIHSGRPCLCFLSRLLKGCVNPMSGYFFSELPFKALLIQWCVTFPTMPLEQEDNGVQKEFFELFKVSLIHFAMHCGWNDRMIDWGTG